MSKRKASPSVLTIDQVMNYINIWLVDEECDRDEEEELDDLCGALDEENENNGDSTEQFILEDEVIENIDEVEQQPLNPQQRYAPQNQLTRNRKVHDTDSSSDKANFEKIIYLKIEGNFEENVEYSLVPNRHPPPLINFLFQPPGY